MKQILCSDWLPEQGLSCPLGIARYGAAKAKFFGAIFWPYNKYFIDQDGSVQKAGQWPRSFFLFAFLWTSTSSRSTKTQKKNLANVSSDLDFTLAITHIE